jgi:hypothetical protein
MGAGKKEIDDRTGEECLLLPVIADGIGYSHSIRDYCSLIRLHIR